MHMDDFRYTTYWPAQSGSEWLTGNAYYQRLMRYALESGKDSMSGIEQRDHFSVHLGGHLPPPNLWSCVLRRVEVLTRASRDTLTRCDFRSYSTFTRRADNNCNQMLVAVVSIVSCPRVSS